MKKIFSTVFLTALLSVGVVAQSVTPKAVFGKAANAVAPVRQQGYEVPFVTKTLANGLEIIVLADNSVPLVTVEFACRNGSFTEPPELNGLSHLYEHMFFKTNRAIVERADYLREIGQMGITYNGTTREEVVNYYFTTTSRFLPTAMRFMKDAARFPLFLSDELKQEIEVVIGEVDRNESNPFFYLDRAINDRLFSKYPTRKNPLGTRESIRSATTEKMRLIQSRYYVPNNSALVVTGDVQPEKVFELAESLFGDWKRREVAPFTEFPLVEHPPLTKSEAEIVQKDVENVIISIGWQGPSIGKDDAATYAADVFSYVVSQPDSRFQRNLIDTGLATSVGIGYYTQRNVGPIQVSITTSPDKAKQAIAAVYKEIEAFTETNYFTDTELENAKGILQSRDLFDREKLSEYAHTLSFWWSSTGIEYFRGYQKNLRAVSREDINRYVKNYIQGKPRVGIALLSADSQRTANLTEADLIGERR